ncbi:hypothetical protein BBJ28_00005974 [Nothophytophthora sp. Chile5]|nr:hypothetical protein BBJ28_00005974 [Nothophytophthora sp. Chile5]
MATSPVLSAPSSTEGDVLLPLSPMDAVMGSFGLTMLYIYPPGAAAFDLERLERSFVAFVNEDYPVLIGELFVDAQTGVVSVKQTPEARQRGASAIRFEKIPTSDQTTEAALESLSLDFMPTKREGKELIRIKCTLLADGGLAIGLNTTHTMFDGEAIFTFMKVWGQHYSGVSKSERLSITHARHLLDGTGEIAQRPHPEFRIPTAKPSTANEGADTAASVAATPMAAPPSTTQHIFHFSPTNMAKIKAAAAQGLSGLEDVAPSYVSTIDAITALFTVLISRARGHGQDVNITTGVNARRRFEPPLPSNYAGNVIFNALSSYTSTELQAENEEDAAVVSPATLATVSGRIRASILERDNAFLRDAIAFLTEQSNLAAVEVGINFFLGPDIMFTSHAHMGVYDAAFDGTRPWYACAPRIPCLDGMTVITEAVRGGEGLDVIVFLECSAMERLKKLCDQMPYLQEQDAL